MTYVKSFLQNEDGFIGSLISAFGDLVTNRDNIQANAAQTAQQRKWQLNDQRQGPTRLRKAAEKADFNPLTLLQAGGLNAGYGNPPSHAPLASTNWLAGIGQAIDEYQNREKEELETERLKAEAELAKIAVDRARSGDVVGSPVGGFKNRSQAAQPIASVKAHAPKTGGLTFGHTYTASEPHFDTVGNPRIPAITQGGIKTVTDPNTSDAEVVEARYGDVIQNVHGIGTAYADYMAMPNVIKRRQQFAAKRENRGRIETNNAQEDLLHSMPVARDPVANGRRCRIWGPRGVSTRSLSPARRGLDDWGYRRDAGAL